MQIAKSMSYRKVIAHYDLILCDSPVACDRDLSVNRHVVGAADRMGHIHWSRADHKVTRRGLRSLLVVIAGVHLKHSRRLLPEWERLYEANIWAWKEALNTWKQQITQEMSKNDRMRAARLARGQRLRSTNFPLYQWMRGRKKQWTDD